MDLKNIVEVTKLTAVMDKVSIGGSGTGYDEYVDEVVSNLPAAPQENYLYFLTTDLTINKITKGIWKKRKVVDGAQIRNKLDDRVWTVKGPTATPDIGEIAYPVSTVAAFTPKYWTINGPISQSFCIVTSGDIATVHYTSRKHNDLCGLIWSTKDEHDHEGLAYETKVNLNGVKFKFKLSLSGSVPTLISDKSPTLTITSNDGTISYVRLANYALEQSEFEGVYEIDFSTVKVGFSPTTAIDVSDIKTIMIGLISSEFNDALDTALAVNLESTLSLQLLEPSSGHTMLALNKLTVPEHNIKMCTAYDDTFNISPERILYNTYMLGYRGYVDHYVGMSHYYQKIWNTAEFRFRIVEDGSLNIPCHKWHESYFALAKSYGFETIVSLSFELYSESCPFEWTQRDWNDQYAQTSYAVPSYILSPCIPAAMSYIHAVFLKFAKMQADKKMQVIVQVGEPWWWYNPSTNLPCIYDYPTRLAFFDETGQYAADIGSIYDYKTGGVHDLYVAFVSKKLGEAVQGCGAAIKAVYPDAKITLLPFLPSIVGAKLLERINLPVAEYQYPNFDFYMTEGYDWLMEGKMLKLYDAILTPAKTLKYPLANIHVLVGFVPDAALAEIYGFEQGTPYRRELWKRIIGSVRNNLYHNVGQQYIWAYPQIMFDSLTIMPYSQYDYFFLGKAAYRVYVDERPLNMSI